MKTKNKVTLTKFINWYFFDSDDVKNLGKRAIENLLTDGFFRISAMDLFEECGYIPQHICEVDGDGEYHPSEVEFINDANL
jgi:hypothetical protein